MWSKQAATEQHDHICYNKTQHKHEEYLCMQCNLVGLTLQLFAAHLSGKMDRLLLS